MLEAWFEFHRTTLLLKCEGLDDLGRRSRPVPTSKLSLHGLVRHMAEVERNTTAMPTSSASSSMEVWAGDRTIVPRGCSTKPSVQLRGTSADRRRASAK